jgi:thioesterase domain-containing protein
MARIEERFDRALPLAALFEQGSVAGLAELIRSDASAVAASPLVPIQRRGRHAPLAFVHPAGGNVLCYQALSNALGPDVPFFGLQATPSAGTAAARSIGDLARAYKPAVLALGAEREPLLGGWSMGALVAFEVACLLEREDGRAPAVAVLDQVAPGAHGAPVADDELSRLERFAAKVSEFVGADLEVARDELAQQSADEQAAAFLERFKEHQLAPASTTTDEFRGFLDLMLAHNRMTVEYEPSRYAGKVVVLRAARDDDPRPSDLGWQRHCAQQVEVVEVPGTHVSMMKKPAVEALAERLGEWMAAI